MSGSSDAGAAGASGTSGASGGARAVSAELSFTVTGDDTALALGSGNLPVLATPRLLAWCERATCLSVEPLLREGRSSVGTRVELQHVAASPVGAEVIVTSDPSYADGRLQRFRVSGRHTDGKVVATGEVTRVVVDVDRFLDRLA
ncbi:thioesterase family protein [Knoellia aerolata]|uniref:Thioesterase n=1 Tax=Knoellia aerolata DSM 18566 TaxID=1385519 RepID=A0A0A0JMT2_9MICO|nr:thioesterase [Knoellia aerolata]KGN38009.1 thioesterase [Knoellia aerolata DSM 18566]